MKRLLYTGLVIISIVFIFSCSHPKKDDPPPTTTISQKPEEKIFISLAGELDFRRTFANIQFMDDEEEINSYVALQEKSNPELMIPDNEMLRKRFEELGIVKDKGLLLNTFEKNSNPHLTFEDESGKKINVSFKRQEYLGDANPRTTAADSCEIIFRPFQDLRYALLDIIPGGNKEIVVLDEWYIMNGYNFDLMVYEICLK